MTRNKHLFAKLIIIITLACILIPLAVIVLWSFTGRWPWPNLLPQTYTLRTIQELFFGSAKLPQLLLSSITLAAIVALFGTIIGVMTARATELYSFRGRGLIKIATWLPLLVPGTVFAMGIQITLLKAGIADTIAGVALCHIIVALPYCITIMTDVTNAVGIHYEEQAMVLGASPLRAFFQVTLPALMPGILSSMSMGFILSYCQYFTTLLIGGGKIKTIALVLIPYIQSGDRALSAIYSVVFAASALLVFFILEGLILKTGKGGKRK